MALKLGLALGTYVKGGTVVVGRDIRTSALPVELALNSGLVSTGCKVYALGIVTTPTLAISTKMLKGDAGVIITASHNPPEYIGVKFWNRSGLGFTPEQELEIEEIFNGASFADTPWDKVGSVVPISDVNETHVDRIVKKMSPARGGREFSVIVDPGNGSSCEIAPLLMKKLGVKFVTLNSQYDGHFPGRMSEPSEKNLRVLARLIQASEDFDFGVALDGDADRVVFLDEKGNRIEPIHLLALLAKDALERGALDGFEPVVATPIDSTSVLEAVVEPLGGRVVRCEVGDIKVAIEVRDANGFLGGETAGTYVWPRFHLGPDSLVTIAQVTDLLRREDKDLSELLAGLPTFPYKKVEVPLAGRNQTDERRVAALKECFLQCLDDAGEGDVSIDAIDGLRFNFKKGWVLFRESGTTPILRIMAESHQSEQHLDGIVGMAVEVAKQAFDVAPPRGD